MKILLQKWHVRHLHVHLNGSRILCQNDYVPRVTWVVLPRNEKISSAQGVITRGRCERINSAVYSGRPLVMTPCALLISSFLGSTSRHRRVVCTHTACDLSTHFAISWRNPLAIGHIFSLNKFNCQTRTSLRSVLEVFRLKVGLREFWNIKFCFWSG